MAHILLVTSEMAGRINMMCELARRLDAGGHSAAVASPVDIRSRVEAQGVRYVDVVPPATTSSQPSPRPAPSGLLGRATAFAQRFGTVRSVAARRDAKVAAFGLDRFAAVARAEDPDLMLIDVELPAYIMAAATGALPVALWTSMLSLWKRPGLPPLGSAIVPGRGRQGSQAGIESEWVRYRTWKWLRRQRLRITRLGEDQISVLRTLADDTGFPFRTEADLNQWLIPCTYRSLPIVSFNARELEFPHQPPATCTYAGPLLPAGGKRRHPDMDEAATRHRLDALYERRRSGVSAALLYASFGAWHKGDDRSFLRRILDAVSAHPEWDVIVGLGGRLGPAAIGAVPENVHVFAWAPQLEILAEADCAVHHGGISTVNECITHQVPMVLYPFDFMDQPGNGARVEYHGIGEVGDRSQDTSDVIGARIERLLGDEAVRRQMQKMSDAYAVYQEEDRALAFIESRLNATGRA